MAHSRSRVPLWPRGIAALIRVSQLGLESLSFTMKFSAPLQFEHGGAEGGTTCGILTRAKPSLRRALGLLDCHLVLRH